MPRPEQELPSESELIPSSEHQGGWTVSVPEGEGPFRLKPFVLMDDLARTHYPQLSEKIIRHIQSLRGSSYYSEFQGLLAATHIPLTLHVGQPDETYQAALLLQEAEFPFSVNTENTEGLKATFGSYIFPKSEGIDKLLEWHKFSHQEISQAIDESNMKRDPRIGEWTRKLHQLQFESAYEELDAHFLPDSSYS